MIAISLSAVITSAFYQIFLSQQRAYLVQEQVAEMQQNLRTGLDILARDIRSAGFDPELNGLTRFVTDFAPPNDIFATDIDYAVDKNIIAFTKDFNENGTIDATRAEMIVYRISGNRLQRYNIEETDPTRQWETVAANIDALDFVLLAQDGTVTTNLAMPLLWKSRSWCEPIREIPTIPAHHRIATSAAKTSVPSVALTIIAGGYYQPQ